MRSSIRPLVCVYRLHSPVETSKRNTPTSVPSQTLIVSAATATCRLPCISASANRCHAVSGWRKMNERRRRFNGCPYPVFPRGQPVDGTGREPAGALDRRPGHVPDATAKHAQMGARPDVVGAGRHGQNGESLAAVNPPDGVGERIEDGQSGLGADPEPGIRPGQGGHPRRRGKR